MARYAAASKSGLGFGVSFVYCLHHFPEGPKDPIIRYSGVGFRVPLKGSIRGLEDFEGPKDPIIRYSGLG